MCGRFTMRAPGKLLAEVFQLDQQPELPFRYNIAPTQTVATVRKAPDQDKRELALLRWGLIPSWAKDRAIGNRLINARADSVADKPSFRSAFKRRRCLILADGFYEWQKTGSKKQPFHIRLQDGGPFGMAGLWESWQSEDGEVIESCTIITTEANEVVRPVHDRMPVILPRDVHEQWLAAEANPQELTALLQPYPGKDLEAIPVSSLVNNARNEDPKCCEPLQLGA